MTDLTPRERLLDHGGFSFDLDSERRIHIMAPDGTPEKGISFKQCDDLAIALRMVKEILNDRGGLAAGDASAKASRQTTKKLFPKVDRSDAGRGAQATDEFEAT